MPFDTALSGIRAASNDLSVTGNNIANASTTGFKSSRSEFADVYATSVLGAGANAIGSGVQVQDVRQLFSQGNVAFTEQSLDLAINGNGFFVLSQGGEINYSRAGAFGLDEDGFIVNATDARLQGFSADTNGNISGIAGDIQIQTSTLDPRQTTTVEAVLNLDASEPVLQSIGSQFSTEGNEIGVTRVGLQSATTTNLTGGAFTLPLVTDFSAGDISFDIDLSASSGNNGTVSVRLDTLSGVPATVNNFNDLRTLTSVINSQIFSPTVDPLQSPIDVVANAVDLGGGNFEIQFETLQDGENSQIGLSNSSVNATEIGVSNGLVSTGGIAAVSNGYPSQSIDITSPDGSVVTYTSQAGASAASIASELNAIQGVSATAQTTLTLSAFNSPLNNMTVNINGIDLTSTSLGALEAEINLLTNTTLPGITATLDTSGAILTLSSAGGEDLRIGVNSTDDGDSLTVTGDPDAGSQTLEVDSAANGIAAGNSDAGLNSVVVGGALNITLEEGYAMGNQQPPVGLYQANITTTPITINAFDPADQSTYNSATSMTVFDSLGNAHVLTQYFVRQNFDPTDPTSVPNHWQVHVLIDGNDVGDPDTSLPAPDNLLATRATYDVFFNEDGSLNETLTPDILISNWTPLDIDGVDNGALGPQTVLAGGTIPIPEPPSSSNFIVDFAGTTQFGSDFAINNVDQNGFATGRLSGLSIDDSGIIFARFTNGESQILGQVALASFPNQEGLQPSGNSMWVENFQSGQANIAAANTGPLGAIQSGALEESNVDLSAELVNLIIAQRNFQASAKTIETADTVTQTIINLR